MSTPCGKCNTCPCGSSSDKKQGNPRQSPDQAGTSGQDGCQQGACSTGGQQQRPAQQQPGRSNKPQVECLCSARARQANTAPVQAPLADSYTCSRPRPVQQAPVPMEELCNCKAKTAPPICECAPPIQPPPQPYREQRQPTHEYITCGQPVQHAGPHTEQYSRQKSQGHCGHCSGQGRKKKCVIQ